MSRLIILALFIISLNAGSAPIERSAEMQTNGSKGRVAILQGAYLHQPGFADARVLGEALSQYGFSVTYLNASQLADSAILNKNNFDCLVLPYGPCYPSSALETIKAYLKSGGNFFSTGGYAFDQPSEPNATANVSTRHGKSGDTMGLEPDQIGVFDPCYHLNYATSVRASSMQSIIPTSFRADFKLEGYSACSMLGSNSPVFPEKWGRHISLVDALDEYGRLRGSVGSIAHNFAGPYAGSSWAFFGVTNTDLFSKDGPMLPYLGAIVEAIVNKTYLYSLSTDLTMYKSGEFVRISCKAANLPPSATVQLTVYDNAGKEAFSKEGALEGQFRLGRFTSDLYRVTAEVKSGGRTIDMLETGFLAYPPAVTSGPTLNYKDNYFRVGNRPVLLTGTNVTGAIFYSANENPLVWGRDLARMNEQGLNVLRVLHFSPFVSETPSSSSTKPLDLDIDWLPTRIERQLDALVQLCLKHNIVMFLSIHDWMDVALTDEELQAQRRFAHLIANRYRRMPFFIIDIQNEPNIPREAQPDESADVLRVWNDFLRDRYGTDKALRDAWTSSPPEAPLGSVPWRLGTDAWDDMRTFDADLFRNVLANRWIAANRSGAEKGDPHIPVTVGFLQEYWALNKLMCMDKLDFANMHSYTGMDALRADLKLFDRRFEGKSLSLGEFGSVVDHHKRIAGEDSSEEDFNRYLQTGHYLFGEGGSFLANWCWKDMDDVIFPWGINYGCGGPPKDTLKAYRNQSLLFRRVRPAYKPQEIYLVVPVNQMLGGHANENVRVLYQTVNMLLDRHVDFGTIDDQHLAQLPSSAKLLVYPIPMSIPDDAYPRLKSFVEGGGTLCVTGDVSYDSLRRRTHADRLKELCGVESVDESDHLYINELGKGKVYYTTDPLGDLSVPLSAAKKIILDSPVHAFVIHEHGGASTYVLVNPQASSACASLPNGIELSLDPNGTGLARFDKSGKLIAVESQGPVRVGDRTLDIKGHLALVSCDGQELTSSNELIVLPFGEGELILKQDGLVTQTGEVVDGKWKVLSELTGKKIVISGSSAFDIHIVAPKDRLPALAQSVTRELMLR